MRPISPQIFALVVGFGVACSAGDDGPAADGSGGGSDETGGAAGASGGSVSTGGAGPSGGTATGGTSGSTSGGSGGAATGGQGNGGSTSGGSAGKATGGGGTGGKACTNVRPTGTDWDEATCEQWATETEECSSGWMTSGNYCNESCGRCSSGTGGAATGGTSTGGTSGAGTGGTTPVDIPNTCTEAQGMVCNNMSGRHCG